MTSIDATSGVLELRGLDVGYYKDLNILQDLNVKVRHKQITTILGANGVGKSTALKAAFGFLKPNRGDVVLENESILDIPTHQRILKGLAYIPQQPWGIQRHDRRRKSSTRGLDLSERQAAGSRQD
jgi:branched-chain amino acid transport system ATP-binding protein